MEKEIFISYSQDYEDLILWHALKNEENGFYVDVGANDPIYLSVTKSFYDRGWSGINIEPLEEEYKKLCEERKRDLNLNVGIGNREGKMSLLVLGTLSTFNEREKTVLKESTKNIEEREIQITTFTKIFDENKSAIKNICFFKIDVEGNEKEVLEGIDFTRIRPWVFVVEAVRPRTRISTAESFESILFENDYILAFNDGVSRYYVSKERIELKRKFLKIKELLNIYDVFCVKRYADFQRISLTERMLRRFRRFIKVN